MIEVVTYVVCDDCGNELSITDDISRKAKAWRRARRRGWGISLGKHFCVKCWINHPGYEEHKRRVALAASQAVSGINADRGNDEPDR